MVQPSNSGSAELTIDVGVRNGKTMTWHHLRASGTVTFTNRTSQTLTIRAESAAPFKLGDCAEPATEFEVAPNGSRTVQIHESFKAHEFAYAAQIGDAAPEDPIIILDRH
jgi:hypothetical protein